MKQNPQFFFWGGEILPRVPWGYKFGPHTAVKVDGLARSCVRHRSFPGGIFMTENGPWVSLGLSHGNNSPPKRTRNL